MAVRALKLRAMDSDEAWTRSRIGAGVSLTLGGSRPGKWHVRLAATPLKIAPMTGLQSACGPLWLSDAEPFLNVLSRCPLLLDTQADPHEHAWYWSLFNRHLNPHIQQLLAPLQPLLQPQPVGQGLDCVWQVQLDDGTSAVTQAWMPATTLLRLLQSAHWRSASNRSTAAGLDTDFTLHLPLLLGHCELSPTDLASLRPDDVLLAGRALFSPEGRGTLQAGAYCLHLALIDEQPWCFTLTELETLPMNAPLDDFAPYDPEHSISLDTQTENTAPLDTPDAANDRFDDLPLALTLRAGSLSLSLGQLRNLAVGSVLGFNGCAPGHASLYHGERQVAQGELVDIDGRLGLQITRLDLSR
ncbi:FliM/FliN family flagellar motor switch protein [Pseudomonas fluorescens]|uniref:FliM/FliN family flagellar motor switch protein n=1 Tax=Pseudomonas fluorescens TaxID=294 RepID=A0A944DGV4_PSEFL|nr:FliM/FliN family flagellar motor switch protein [Pseudomonas fluorescens]MBT2298540.1 FliM/FliN family flagellar motor switch protein [Pseudomonas fluorescens]MBT2310065.1 FliM/FliN family flagellar motor switch protein [Pseudomonas fluorescens]MBT2311089.1 FliM/FliN family flagellar motor switch protein [Pseudomonas fluorescens]MBT2319976.1 FliM/FliN family flagellar motor switch protein [Pseudomonas fluorescens]MBT2328996.1 FliM/FliN family flagellar motor switch protein [Pseudomonas fluo